MTPKGGEGSTPRILALDSGPPDGVAGEAEEVGDVEFEKDGDGVSGVMGSCQTLVGVEGFAEDFVGDLEPGGTGVDDDLSSNGVLGWEAAARRARLETRTVG